MEKTCTYFFSQLYFSRKGSIAKISLAKVTDHVFLGNMVQLVLRYSPCTIVWTFTGIRVHALSQPEECAAVLILTLASLRRNRYATGMLMS